MSQISKNSLGMGSGLGQGHSHTHMMQGHQAAQGHQQYPGNQAGHQQGQPQGHQMPPHQGHQGQAGMPQTHHHPSYMPQPPHVTSPQPSPRGPMMMGSMSPGPVSQRMQQQSYSPPQHTQHQHQQQPHSIYTMNQNTAQHSQQSHMPMVPSSTYGSSPIHGSMHPSHPSQPRHPIIAARTNNPGGRPQPIVAAGSHYNSNYQPRNRPRQQRNEDRVVMHKGMGETGSGEPAREPLREVVVLEQPQTTNTKEKTPMCLVNELARYNQVDVQYILEDEQGPAHQKTFFMKLKLGEETYSGTDASIRKAQQGVASMVLEKTQLKKPPERPENEKKPPSHHSHSRKQSDKVPTVELNNLVMRRGEEAVYSPMKQRQQFFKGHPNFNYHGMYNYGRMHVLHYVSLKIGTREFVGFGPTSKAAKNQAANKALRILRHVPMPEREAPKEGEGEAAAPVVVEAKPPAPPAEGEQVKSEVSLIHEIALKRNVHVSFEMVREVGPAHKKMFTTRCILGDLMCECEAQSKKESKKLAAEKMLARMRQIGPLPVSELLVPGKNVTTKKKTKNLIKTQKGDTNYGIDINPISRLIQLMQAQKLKEPEYSFVAERGFPRRKEFIIQVMCAGKTCNGVGQNKKLAKRNAAEAMLNMLGLNQPSPVPGKPALKTAASVTPETKATDSFSQDHFASYRSYRNKKLAKRNAAEAMLNMLGLNQPSPVPGKPALKTAASVTPEVNGGLNADKKVSFVENGGSGEAGAALGDKDRSGRQLIPGLILLPEATRNANTPYIKGRVPGIADPTDMGARRLASGGDGGHVMSRVPAHVQQEVTRMVNTHNMDVNFNSQRNENTIVGRSTMGGIAADRGVPMSMSTDRMKQGGAVLGKR